MFIAVSALAEDEVFPETFQRIAKMKPAEAELAYAQLAEKAQKPAQQDAAWLAAVEKALAQKRVTEADTYLRQIKDEQIRELATLKVLRTSRKWSEIITFSKDFKIEEWKENLIPEAASIRAQAYAICQNAAEAEKDIALAMRSVSTPQQKGEMLWTLSNLYSQYLKDPAKELELMRSTVSGLDGCPHLFLQRIFCRYAELLASQGHLDEGIKVLEEYATKCDAAATRQFNVKVTLGDLYLKKNDPAKAEALYKEAAAVPKLPEQYKKVAEDRLQKR